MLAWLDYQEHLLLELRQMLLAEQILPVQLKIPRGQCLVLQKEQLLMLEQRKGQFIISSSFFFKLDQ